MTGAHVAAVASAVPPARLDQRALWDEHFAGVYDGDARAARIWRSAGVRSRHGVVDPRVEDVSSWGTGARMQRFIEEAVPLGKEAASAALAGSGVSAAEVGLFAVVSCTGYATPGLDIVLARDLGMADAVQRVSIGHMGCYAAVPGLGTVADFAVARQRPALLLCCELTSLHVQPRTGGPSSGRLHADEVQQIVTHALFADAAAAAVVTPGSGMLEIVDIEARTDVTTSDHMSWDVTDLGFRMGLSPQVPDVLARHVRPTVDALLRRHDLDVGDVAAWAVHPGGPRILDVVADRLALDAAQMAASADTLARYGNCSSATVLLILEHLLEGRGLQEGAPVVLLAFGPGLTVYTALVRVTPRTSNAHIRPVG